jgi:hypothetical protein
MRSSHNFSITEACSKDEALSEAEITYRVIDENQFAIESITDLEEAGSEPLT